MLRAALLMVVMTIACSPSRDAQPIDARTDAPVDAAGSGSAAAMAMEASPQDGSLDLMVGVLGIVIAAGPVGALQRRRDTV